jgi:hypothetical protein
MKINYSESELDAASAFIANNNPSFINQFSYIRDVIYNYIEQIKDHDSQKSYYVATMGFNIRAELEDSEWYVDICVSPDVGMYDKRMKTINAVNHNPIDVDPQKAYVQADDHTCASCGNTKCSKVEKSCWKCGATIVV